MGDIRYVCLSDLHFGEEESLMTRLKTGSTDIDPLNSGLVMVQLVKCLEYLIARNEDKTKKPTLVLNGDILELALANTNEATMVFERFAELIFPPGKPPLFDNRIIYVPGNHDHHLWEIARESQYVTYLNKQGGPGGFQRIPWHMSRTFFRQGDSYPDTCLLTCLVQRLKRAPGPRPVVSAVYPNYGLLSRDGQKCVIFHHGHLMDPTYKVMSRFKRWASPEHEMPRQIWEIERENFAWIDFVWSTLGRSGEVGQDIEVIYEKIQDKAGRARLLRDLARGLAADINLPGVPEPLEEPVLKTLLTYLVGIYMSMERKQGGRPLSPGGEANLKAYMEGPLREQILTERSQNIPSDVTFVFGHTHKPFQRDMNFRQYPQWVNVYNTGGWVVDTEQPEPLHGGVIILVDADLNTTAVHLYHESAKPDEYTVAVAAASHPDEPPNELHERIRELVRPAEDPWRTFSSIVAGEVAMRAANLRERIKKEE